MKKTILCGLLILFCGAAFGQPADFQKERQFFDFLIGDWTVQSAENQAEKWNGDGKDRFKFVKALDGKVIVSEWYFNRGTPSKPNFSSALYYMGFDNASRSWTFYYLSPLSSQFYQGKYENDNWYFYKTFTIDGKTFTQRQSWLVIKDGLLQRTIENTEDGGKRWVLNYRGIFRKLT